MPLSTENMVFKVDGGVRVVGGTSLPIYDLIIKDLYGIKLPVHERHGMDTS